MEVRSPRSGSSSPNHSHRGPQTQVSQLDALSLLVTGPADASTLAKVSRWCDDHKVAPESLSLGQRNLEDVFLELTGRGLVDD